MWTCSVSKICANIFSTRMFKNDSFEYIRHERASFVLSSYWTLQAHRGVYNSLFETKVMMNLERKPWPLFNSYDEGNDARCFSALLPRLVEIPVGVAICCFFVAIHSTAYCLFAVSLFTSDSVFLPMGTNSMIAIVCFFVDCFLLACCFFQIASCCWGSLTIDQLTVN